MGRFDRTRSSHDERNVNEKLRGIQFGTVVGVTAHTEEDDFSNHEVNVILQTEDKERRGVPISHGAAGEIAIPKTGDVVVIGFLDGDGESPIVLGSMYTIENRAPLGRAGLYRMRKGRLYSEMDPDGKFARLASKRQIEDDSQTNPDNRDDNAPEARIEIRTNAKTVTKAENDSESMDEEGSETVIKLTRKIIEDDSSSGVANPDISVDDEFNTSDMGIELNLDTGEFKIGDGSGYGIVSDGEGNFTWYRESLETVETGETITWGSEDHHWVDEDT